MRLLLAALLLFGLGCEEILSIEDCAEFCGPTMGVQYSQQQELCVCFVPDLPEPEPDDSEEL